MYRGEGGLVLVLGSGAGCRRRFAVAETQEDNYGYIVIDEESKMAACIDPVEPAKVLKAAEELGASLIMILTTHKHWDHANGNKEMATMLGPATPVLGGEVDSVEACTRPVRDGDKFTLGRIRFTCMHTPGHTMGHICYTAEDDRADGKEPQRAVFTGDTLFVGGAGKFFEGTASDMYISLYEKLGKLPPDTKVYCGHEYTTSNYRFALSVEPDNETLKEAALTASALRANGLATIPSTMRHELATNPFMRVHEPTIKAAVAGGAEMTPQNVLGAVREMKNNFR